MVQIGRNDPEDITKAMTLLEPALRKFMGDVSNKEEMDFTECCIYILQHFTIFFNNNQAKERRNFERAVRIQNIINHPKTNRQYYVHSMECLREISLHIERHDLEQQIVKLLTNGMPSIDSQNYQTSPTQLDSTSSLEQGKACCEHQQWFEAMDIFNRAILCDLNEPELYFHRALCEVNLGFFDLAENDARFAIYLNSKRPEYYGRLARALVSMEMFQKAIGACEQGLQIDETNEELLNFKEKCQLHIAPIESMQCTIS